MSRTGEVNVSALAKAGLTTVVGTLGIDTISFDLRHLLVKAVALDMEGVSTRIYTGGYQLPARTITDSVLSDLSLIEKVVGVKIALFDSLSSHPTREALAALASQTWLGGRLGGKAGLVHAHIGDCAGSFVNLVHMLREMGLPPGMLVTTHINRSARVLEEAIAGSKLGLSVDITALYTPDRNMEQTIGMGKALKILLEAGVPLENITVSSDSNAAYPYRDAQGIAYETLWTPVDAVAVELRKAVREEGLPLSQVLQAATSNPARRLRLEAFKGRLEVGKHADVVLLDEDLKIQTVIARGRALLLDGAPVVRGIFEKAYHDAY
jgi:beta-aspartyl-dipeptidase (metallo-type)